MRLCGETITVLNQQHSVDTTFTHYRKTVIHGVSWYGDLKANVDSSGLKTANMYIVRIPADADFGGKTFLEPGSGIWESYYVFDSDNSLFDDEAVFAVDADQYFTLAVGDLIVRGEVTEDDEELTRKVIHDRYERFTEVLTILSVTNNRRTQNAPHWKVVGA